MVNSNEYQSLTDVNKQATFVINSYETLIDKYMPLRKLSKQERRFHYTPFINKKLQKEIEVREKLYKSVC